MKELSPVQQAMADTNGTQCGFCTIGYRTDKTVLKQLLDKPFFYLGLLGSDHKIKTLFKELREEGITEGLLSGIFSPVGLNIASKTTREIAVSIAAEIIQKKNNRT